MRMCRLSDIDDVMAVVSRTRQLQTLDLRKNDVCKKAKFKDKVCFLQNIFVR
jgi:hypothetical protein